MQQVVREPKEVWRERMEEQQEKAKQKKKEQQERNDEKTRMKGKNKASRRAAKKQNDSLSEKKVRPLLRAAATPCIALHDL